MTVSQTRKNSTPIKVYCLPDEKAQIQENAEASGLSVASFIRKVAMGYQVESIVDIEQVVELSRVGNDSNLLIVFYVQIMPDDFVMQLHRF